MTEQEFLDPNFSFASEWETFQAEENKKVADKKAKEIAVFDKFENDIKATYNKAKDSISYAKGLTLGFLQRLRG